LSPEASILLLQLHTYTLGDRVMMVKYLGQVDMELAGLARDLVELEELEKQEMREDRRQGRWWTRDWLLRRPLHGQYEALMAELELEDLRPSSSSCV